MKSLLQLCFLLSTTRFGTHPFARAFTIQSVFSKPCRNILIHDAEQTPSSIDRSKDDSDLDDPPPPPPAFETSSVTTTITSQTKSTLFADRKLYVGESFEDGLSLYSDLEDSAELFVENEVEMEVASGNVNIKDATSSTSVESSSEEQGGTSEEDTLETNDDMDDAVMDDTTSTMVVVEEIAPLSSEMETEEESLMDEVVPESKEVPYFTEEIIQEEQTTEEEEELLPTPAATTTIETQSTQEEDTTNTPGEEDSTSSSSSNERVLLAAERLEKALRQQVLTAEQDQASFQAARAEAIARAKALSPLSEQVAQTKSEDGSTTTTKRQQEQVNRAETILRTRLLFEGEIADDRAKSGEKGFIGSIRSFFAPRTNEGELNTKAERKRSKYIIFHDF